MEMKEKVKELIVAQIDELVKIVEGASKDDDFDSARERLRRWKERTITLISSEINPIEGEKLSNKRKMSFIGSQPLRNLVDEANMYRGFLISLIEEIDSHPEALFKTKDKENQVKPKEIESQPSDSKAVFIVHGHDELNLYLLEKLLRERLNLDPVILKAEASKGRTIIEKFEQEAKRAPYAFILFTPDDFVEVSGDKYAQARPNVIFEIGWFYGRLGRERVCILLKKGTKIHSDLDGVMRIEFNDSINECLLEIECELKGVGLI